MAGVIPTPLWIVLFFVSAVIFAFMLFFADSGERKTTQAMLMGAVTATITTLLLLIVFFDRPFNDGVGGLQPDSMERTLDIIDQNLDDLGITVDAPCDARGVATDA